MQKKQVSFVVCVISMIVLIFTCLSVLYLNSDLYYSKKLVAAIRNGETETAIRIIRKKPSSINTYPSLLPKWWQSAMNIRVVYPLTEACLIRNNDLVHLLVEAGANVNCNDGLTPLSVTLRYKGNGWSEIAKYLIDSGASLDYTTDYSGASSAALQDILERHTASDRLELAPEKEEDVTELFFYILEHCEHASVNWMRVLQYSVSYERNEIIKFLLENDYCEINAKTESCMTALMFAARDASAETVSLLLSYGADVDMVDKNGYTALDYALKRGNADVIALLS